MQDKIENVYDVRKVYAEEQLQKLLKGVHGEQYRKNIDHVKTLKQNISDSLHKASKKAKDDPLSCKQLEDAGVKEKSCS